MGRGQPPVTHHTQGLVSYLSAPTAMAWTLLPRYPLIQSRDRQRRSASRSTVSTLQYSNLWTTVSNVPDASNSSRMTPVPFSRLRRMWSCTYRSAIPRLQPSRYADCSRSCRLLARGCVASRSATTFLTSKRRKWGGGWST